MKEIKCNFPSTNICLFDVNGNQKAEFAVFGDSHAVALAPIFLSLQKEYRKPFIYSARPKLPATAKFICPSARSRVKKYMYYIKQ
jgi:hypothetical protein